LPFLFTTELGEAEIEVLATALAEALGTLPAPDVAADVAAAGGAEDARTEGQEDDAGGGDDVVAPVAEGGPS
jgi:hypothetical protein